MWILSIDVRPEDLEDEELIRTQPKPAGYETVAEADKDPISVEVTDQEIISS